MISDDLVANHYTQDDLGRRIEAAFIEAGIDLDSITTAELATVDEFHTGGRPATVHLLDKLEIATESSVLDLGCGIGGAARFCSEAFDCVVTGVDLTATYIEAAELLAGWVGLTERVSFRHANAADLPFKKNRFDGAFMFHVGMNVADKTGLFSSLAQVLRPSSRFGIYDLMRTSIDDLTFPLPWSSSSATSFLSTADSYQSSLTAAGFELIHVEDRTESVLAFMTEAAAKVRSGEPPPAVGLHLLMGPDAGVKLSNTVSAIQAGAIAPIEIVARLLERRSTGYER